MTNSRTLVRNQEKTIHTVIKAIFFDVDGTLLSFRTHRVPDSAVEALQRAHEKGVKLFIASGRRKADIDQAHLPDVFDGYVTLNGSRCFLSDGTVVFERFIDREDIETLVAWQETSQVFPCALVTQEKLHLNFTDENVALLGRQLNLEMPPADDLQEWIAVARSGVSQMLWFISPQQQAEVMAHFPHCRMVRWSPLFGDVIPESAGKDVGIARMVNYLGIRMEDTMAFGDGGNDIAMLHAVGTGVAMGNAAPEVRRAADFVTTPADEDGIALAFEHFDLL